MRKLLAFVLLAMEVAVLALAGALVQGLPLAAAQPPGAALTNVLGPEETLAAPVPETTYVNPAAGGGKGADNLRKLLHKLLQDRPSAGTSIEVPALFAPSSEAETYQTERQNIAQQQRFP